MRKPTLLRLCLAGALLAAAAGCGGGRPDLPGELSAAESLPVKKKLFILFTGERLTFGDWSVKKVKRDTSHSIERPRYSRIRVALDETYSFQMRGGGSESWTAECRNHGERQDEIPFIGPIRERGYRITLQCDLRSSAAPAAWRLDLSENDSSGAMKGMLTNGSESVRVDGSRALGGNSRSDAHTWFEFAGDGAVFGAVVLARGDRVLLHRTAANGLRPALAAASAALLLYLDSNERMKAIVESRLQADRMMFL